MRTVVPLTRPFRNIILRRARLGARANRLLALGAARTDGTNLSFDDEGLELRDMKAVQEEAARALAGLAWDSVRNFNGAQSDQMTIEVRDNLGSVMQVRFAFEIARRQ